MALQTNVFVAIGMGIIV